MVSTSTRTGTFPTKVRRTHARAHAPQAVRRTHARAHTPQAVHCTHTRAHATHQAVRMLHLQPGVTSEHVNPLLPPAARHVRRDAMCIHVAGVDTVCCRARSRCQPWLFASPILAHPRPSLSYLHLQLTHYHMCRYTARCFASTPHPATGTATGGHYNPYQEEHGCFPGMSAVLRPPSPPTHCL